MIEIKVFKASEGDSILVSFGSNKDTNIMIDMGLDTTYTNYIKPELIRLNKKGKKIDLLVITHVDNDHIFGAIEFIKENKDISRIIKVGEVWHNTYRHLKFNNVREGSLSLRDERELKGIIGSNSYKSFNDGGRNISVMQGTSLGGYLLKYNYSWNKSFNGRAIKIEENKEGINVKDNIKIILISPNQEKLDKLSGEWIADLNRRYNIKKIGKEQIWDDAFEFYMSNLNEEYSGGRDTSNKIIDIKDIESLASKEEKDTSKTNGSTISFIIEYKEKDLEKKLLFLGDSHEDIVFEQLEKLKNKGYKLIFDVVKISHHGSNKNTSQRLIDLIESEKFIISTDGRKHNHPNIELISKILNRKSKKKIDIIFNYNIERNEYLKNEELKSKYNYDIKVLEDNEIIII
jgi:beta-lactamase superfamily II metal-dependent hydrolase